MKKIIGTLILLAAASSIGCSVAPVGTGEPTATGSETAAKQETATAAVDTNAGPKRVETLTRSCSRAQVEACIAANDGWPCNCELNGNIPQCIYCQ